MPSSGAEHGYCLKRSEDHRDYFVFLWAMDLTGGGDFGEVRLLRVFVCRLSFQSLGTGTVLLHSAGPREQSR